MTLTRQSSRSDSSRSLPVWVTGEIDAATVPGLRRALKEATPDQSGRVVVDLSGVTFMDCSGLGPLLEAETRLGSRLSLRGVPPRVTALLRLAGLQARFGIADDATAGMSGPPEKAVSGIVKLEENVANQRARLSGRARIDQAKGLLMATHGCDADQAWELLFRASRTKGVQVHDLADALAEAAAGRDVDQSSAAMRAAVLSVMAPGGDKRGDVTRADDPASAVADTGRVNGRESTEGT